MDDLYREIIIERYKTPQFRGTLDPHDISFEDENPLCGDHIRVDLRVDENNKICEAAFSGHGCAISQASSDLLMEFVIGKTLDEIKELHKLGVVRLKCALLPLKVLKAGVYGMGADSSEMAEEE